MPQDPPEHGLDPDEQPTQPLPQAEPSQQAAPAPDVAANGSTDAPTVAFTPAVDGSADAPTMAFEPITDPTEPIAPYVPIADLSADDVGGGPVGAAAAPLEDTRDRKSPVPWLIGAAIAVMAAAVALGIWQPWADGGAAPVVPPAPSVSVTPTLPPIEGPTEEPTSEPSPTVTQEPAPAPAPAPQPTQEPEPDPAPTEITPAPGQSAPPALKTTEPAQPPA
jgi:hypothetical protein